MTSIPARQASVSGRTLRYFDVGQGAPTVVLESGLGASALEWAALQPRLAEVTRVVSYDRAGYGGSAPADEPRTAMAAADDLVELLRTSAVPGPYVLAGHSWGGAIARFAAARLTGEVAGLVLIDATHETLTLQRNPLVLAVLDRRYRSLQRSAESGRLRARVDAGKGKLLQHLLAAYPPEIRDRLKAEYCSSGFHQASRAEARGLKASLAVLPDVPLPAAPVVAVTGGRATRLDARTRRQITAAYRTMTDGLPDARHVIAPNSGHFVPQHDPDVVVDVIVDLVRRARRSRQQTRSVS